jgi:pyruvate/2-oxoacid:ferredoxin oxidoreductase beta subunit
LHNAFENSAATMSGVEAAYKALFKKGKVTKKINRLELFHKLHIVETYAKDFVVIFFKIVDTYGKNSNFFKILENSSVVDKTKVER